MEKLVLKFPLVVEIVYICSSKWKLLSASSIQN